MVWSYTVFAQNTETEQQTRRSVYQFLIPENAEEKNSDYPLPPSIVYRNGK